MKEAIEMKKNNMDYRVIVISILPGNRGYKLFQVNDILKMEPLIDCVYSTNEGFPILSFFKNEIIFVFTKMEN